MLSDASAEKEEEGEKKGKYQLYFFFIQLCAGFALQIT